MEKIDLIEWLIRTARMFRRCWALVLVLTVLSGGFGVWRSHISYTPIYEATARLSVSSSYQGDNIFASSYYDSQTAQHLAAAFPHIMGTDLMKDLMLERLGTESINGTITPRSVADTNMFVLTVRSTVPEDAYDILWAAIECFPQVAIHMVDDPRVDVVDEPVIPTAPINARRWQEPLARSMATGAALGLGLVAAMAMATHYVTAPDQLRAIANLPVMATFPKLAEKKRRNGMKKLIQVESDPGMAEALRGLSLKVRKFLETSTEKTVVVTSTVSGEGKTTTAINLARSLAEDGSSVVLVDGDLRNQTIARMFGVAATSRGLLDCLKDPGLPVGGCVRRIEGTTMSYLSGASADDWRYSMDARAMKRILAELNREYDYVVLDAPPSLVVADAVLLCCAGACVLYVVKCDTVRQAQIYDSVSNLYDRGAPMAGFVMNCVPRSGSRYGYGQRYGYGYNKYGYGKYGYGTKK